MLDTYLIIDLDLRLNEIFMFRHQGKAALISKRECDILQLIGKGRTSKEIAWELHLSKQTVSSYRKNICRKLDIHSTAELIAYALPLRRRV